MPSIMKEEPLFILRVTQSLYNCLLNNIILIQMLLIIKEEHPSITSLGLATCQAIKALIENGARIDSKDQEGLSILHCAAQGNNAPVIALLVNEYGLDPNILRNVDSNTPFCTPLGMATQKHACLAEFALLCAGAKLTDDEKEHCAELPQRCLSCLRSVSDKQTMLDALSKNSLAPWDPNVIDPVDLSTPLLKAAKRECFLCVSFLLKDKRTNPNIKDGEENTALHYSVRALTPFICCALLNLQRTNLTIQDKNGHTAHQLAAMKEATMTLNLINVASHPTSPFALRKMRVNACLSLKNARCSEHCNEKHVRIYRNFLMDICIKIARLLTLDTLPHPKRNAAVATEQTEARTDVQEATPATPLTPPRPEAIT